MEAERIELRRGEGPAAPRDGQRRDGQRRDGQRRDGQRRDDQSPTPSQCDDAGQLRAQLTSLRTENASLRSELTALRAEVTRLLAERDAIHRVEAPVRVILVDDTSVYLNGLRLSLESFEEEVRILGEAQTAEEALALALDRQPDVAVLDLKIPPRRGPVRATPDQGIALIGQIKQGARETRVLALSNHNEIEIVRAAINAGADGYVAKDDNYEGAVFVETFKQIRRGVFMLGPSIAELVLRSNGLGEQLAQAMSEIARAGRPRPVSTDIIRTLTSARRHDDALH